MAIADATIGGVHLLALNTVGWVFTPGTKPYQRVFVIARDDLDAFEKTARDSVTTGGLDLTIEYDGGLEPAEIHRLWYLHRVPTQHPDMVGILISDIRWKWPYVSVVRRYNIKRRTGNKRQLNTGDASLSELFDELQFTTDDQVYAACSLLPASNYTKRWNPEDVLTDVLNEVTLFQGAVTGVDFANAVEVEGLEIDDPGNDALARVMALVPGTQCKVTKFGVTQLYNVNDGSEIETVGNAGDPFVGSALPEMVSRAAERPATINVHLSCEDELRFDYVEVTSTAGKDDRTMRCVMPLPTQLTFTSGVLSGKTVAAGTWVEITDDLLASFAAKYPPITPSGKVLPTLTLAILRQVWCNGGYNKYMECLSNQDPIYANWLKQLRLHYRQTFQINIRWMERLLGILDRRVALIDPLNDAWAPASVYANYALVPSYRRIGRTDGDPTQLAYNRITFSDASSRQAVASVVLAGSALAQAVLQVIDPTLGIVHIDYFIDAIGNTMGVVPSEIEGYDPNQPPTASGLTLPNAGVDTPLKVFSHSRLMQLHALAIIVTGITGSPNDLNQTWNVPVTIDAAKSHLPEPVAKQLDDAYGPDMHVHCNVRTARFAWSDQNGAPTRIERAVIFGEPRDENLLVNKTEIQDVAEALAASIYSGMIDHLSGEVTVESNQDIELTGRIGSVEHGLTPEGVAFTRVTLPTPSRPTFDVWSLLPEFVRRIIKRQLPQPR